MIEWTNQNARNALSEVQNLIMFLINLQPHKRTVKKQAKDPQSRTKLLENLYPFIHTIEHNNTTSTTTDLRYQIHLPPGQSCFLQMSKDQGCFRTHNNIASKGRGEGRHSTTRMLGKMLWECDTFPTVLSKIADSCSSTIWMVLWPKKFVCVVGKIRSLRNLQFSLCFIRVGDKGNYELN